MIGGGLWHGRGRSTAAELERREATSLDDLSGSRSCGESCHETGNRSLPAGFQTNGWRGMQPCRDTASGEMSISNGWCFGFQNVPGFEGRMVSVGVCGRARISEAKVGLELFRPSLDRKDGVPGVGV